MMDIQVYYLGQLPMSLLAVLGCALALSAAFIFKKPIWGLYLAIASTAVLKSPELPIVREKLCATEFLMLITWAALLFEGLKSKPLRKNEMVVQNKWLAIGFAFCITLSGLINGFGIGGDRAQYTFVETANYIYGLFIYLTVIHCVRSWGEWRNCLWAWCAGAVIVSVVGTVATFTNSPEWAIEFFTGRVCSTLRNENQVPSFLLPILPVVLISFAVRKNSLKVRLSVFMLIALMMLTTFGTGSRTGIGMLILCGLGVYWIWVKERNSKQIAFKALGTMAIVFSVGIIAYFMVALAAFDGHYRLGYTPAWQRPAAMLYLWASGNHPLDGTRPLQMAAVFEQWHQNPIFGVGPKLAVAKFNTNEIHNTYLGVFAEIGLLGILTFLAWMLHTLITPYKMASKELSGLNRSLLLALIVGFVLSLFYQCFCYGLRQRNIWIITGLLAVTPALVEDSRRRYKAHLKFKKKSKIRSQVKISNTK